MSEKEWISKDMVKLLVAGGRFTLMGSNFAMSTVFALWLASNAFTMDTIKKPVGFHHGYYNRTITGRQTFYTDRVLQSEADPSTMPGFGSVYLPTLDNTTIITG